MNSRRTNPVAASEHARFVRIGLSPRARGLSRDQAQAHWRGVHAGLFARMPHVRSYVQNHMILTPRGTPLLKDPGFDIFSEVEFTDEMGMAQAMASRWYREAVILDERVLLDATRRCYLLTRRFGGTVPPSGGHFKLVEFIAGTPHGAGASQAWNWLCGDCLGPVAGGPAGHVQLYLVDAVGGEYIRRVDAVLVRWCEEADEACALHRQLSAWLRPGCGLTLHASVVVREHEVMPCDGAGREG